MKETYKLKGGFTNNYILNVDGEIFHIKKTPYGENLIRIKPHLARGRKRVFIDGKFRDAAMLIATTFIPNPKNKKFVDFIDGEAENVSPSNLKWVSQHDREYKPIFKKQVYQYKKDRTTEVAVFDDVAEASGQTRVTKSNIYKVCSTGEGTAGGYFWSYGRYLGSSYKALKNIYQYTHDKKHLIKKYSSIHKAALKSGLSAEDIDQACSGEDHILNGYYWETDTLETDEFY